MDVATLSMVNSLSRTPSVIGMHVLKMSMDIEQTTNLNMISMMIPASPTLGKNVDVSA